MRERPAILYLDMVPGEPIQEMEFLEATEGTKADVISYSGTMGFGFFTALRTGADVNTNRFAGADEPWRNAVNEFAAMGLDAWLRAGARDVCDVSPSPLPPRRRRHRHPGRTRRIISSRRMTSAPLVTTAPPAAAARPGRPRWPPSRRRAFSMMSAMGVGNGVKR